MAGPLHLRRGREAEQQALNWLRRKGLRLVERNLRCRFGEVDLVMADGDTLVFVEVRCRRAGNLVSAAESVDARKQRKLVLTAAWFMRGRTDASSRPVRFDVVAIDRQSGKESALQWIKDAFRPGA